MKNVNDCIDWSLIDSCWNFAVYGGHSCVTLTKTVPVMDDDVCLTKYVHDIAFHHLTNHDESFALADGAAYEIFERDVPKKSKRPDIGYPIIDGVAEMKFGTHSVEVDFNKMHLSEDRNFNDHLRCMLLAAYERGMMDGNIRRIGLIKQALNIKQGDT